MKLCVTNVEGIDDEGMVVFSVKQVDEFCAEIKLTQNLHSHQTMIEVTDAIRTAFAMLNDLQRH